MYRILAVLVGILGFMSGSPAAGEGAPALGPADFYSPEPQIARLIAVQLREHPALLAADAGLRSAEERIRQARSLPDPQLTYRWFARPVETRVGPQEHGLELSQPVPWRGKLSSREEGAKHEARARSWDLVGLQRSLVAELKRIYFEAGYLQEALAVNADEKALLRRFERSALNRYATGEGNQQSVVKVQTDISRLEDQRVQLEERLAIRARELARLIGRPWEGLDLEPISLALPDPPESGTVPAHQVLETHPEVRAAAERIESREAALQARRLEGRPDFRFGLAWISVGEREDDLGRALPPEDNGEDALALSVGINLPIYRSRVDAGRIEAASNVEERRHLLRETVDRLHLSLQEAFLRVDSLQERASLYGELLIPQAEESLASAEAAYRTNRIGFLDLLDAQRVLFQVRLTRTRFQADYWIAMTDTEESLGRRFP